MNIRDQHLKTCKNKAIKFVKSGEIAEAISFLEKELNFFKQTKNKESIETLQALKLKGNTSEEEMLSLIKSLS